MNATWFWQGRPTTTIAVGEHVASAGNRNSFVLNATWFWQGRPTTTIAVGDHMILAGNGNSFVLNATWFSIGPTNDDHCCGRPAAIPTRDPGGGEPTEAGNMKQIPVF